MTPTQKQIAEAESLMEGCEHNMDGDCRECIAAALSAAEARGAEKERELFRHWWSLFPGRSCGEYDWNIWTIRMDAMTHQEPTIRARDEEWRTFTGGREMSDESFGPCYVEPGYGQTYHRRSYKYAVKCTCGEKTMSDSGRQMREQCRDCGKFHDSHDWQTCVANLRDNLRKRGLLDNNDLPREPMSDAEVEAAEHPEHEERCGDS